MKKIVACSTALLLVLNAASADAAEKKLATPNRTTAKPGAIAGTQPAVTPKPNLTKKPVETVKPAEILHEEPEAPHEETPEEEEARMLARLREMGSGSAQNGDEDNEEVPEGERAEEPNT